MSFVEFIGFIIVFIAMVYINIKKRRLEQSIEEQPAAAEQTSVLLPSRKEEPQEDMAADHVPDEFELQMIKERSEMKGLQRKLFHSPGEKQAYELKGKGDRDKLSWFLSRDLQDAIILKEILDKPKGL